MGLRDNKTISDFLVKFESRSELSELVPRSVRDRDISKKLQKLSTEVLFAATQIRNFNFTEAVKSGLFQLNDDLDAAHHIAQEITTTTGSYWHGIMHRREPDYSNSKYWFRRAMGHALFPKVSHVAIEYIVHVDRPSSLLQSYKELCADWNPFLFIEWCQAAESKDTPDDVSEFLKTVQYKEIILLLEYSYDKAVGG